MYTGKQCVFIQLLILCKLYHTLVTLFDHVYTRLKASEYDSSGKKSMFSVYKCV